jgi:hypothetical protein
VNVIVAAGLGAVLADTAGTDGVVTILIGVLAALLYAGLVFYPAHRDYRHVIDQLPTAPDTEPP